MDTCILTAPDSPEFAKKNVSIYTSTYYKTVKCCEYRQRYKALEK